MSWKLQLNVLIRAV